MSVRVLVADDHKLMREGLRALLDGAADTTVVAEADNGRDAVDLAVKLRPEVVLMDVTMPDLNGIEAARRIGAACPGVRVVALSMHADKRFVAKMFAAGAAGYLLKDCAFEELLRAVRTVAAGQGYLSPQISASVLEDYGRHLGDENGSVLSLLTDREREVLQLIAEGLNTKSIAYRLHLSPKTIETHRQHLMTKLHCTSVAELIKISLREGLTSLDL